MAFRRPVWTTALFLSIIAMSESGEPPRASNLTCFGYNFKEFVCTWVPGDKNVEYVAKWRDDNDWDFWYECKNMGQNKCKFFGEITNDRQVAVQPKYNATDTSTVKIWLDILNIIPLPPRYLTVSMGDRPEQLNATWNDSEGFELNNQLYFRLRYRKISSKGPWAITPDLEGHQFIINGLDAFALYEIQIQARYHTQEDVYGNWSNSTYATTKEGAPSGLVSVLPVLQYSNGESKSRDVRISWMELPKHHWRGILLGYKVQLVGPSDHTKEGARQFQVAANETTLLILGLKTYVNYSAYLCAYNSVGATEPSSISIPITEEPGSWYTYILILVCLLTVLLVSRVCWMKIKKFKSGLEPLPEPRFFKLELSEQQKSTAQLEKETFDELRQNKQVKQSRKVNEEVEEEISTYSIVREIDVERV